MTTQREPIDWDEALRLHEAEGWTFADIAREFGYAYNTVRHALTERGAHGRRPANQGKVERKLRELWRFTHEKCENPRHLSYPLYGAKGVRVAPEWSAFEPFGSWARASGYRLGRRLVRVSDHLPYGPSNCEWVTAAERVQARKPRRQLTRNRQYPSPIDWKEATRLYLEEGLSQPAVARRMGASYTGILAGFKRLGIARPRLPASTSTAEGRRLHKTWTSLHARCEDPHNSLYAYNGARGTRVAAEWREFEPFLRWALTTGAKPGLCLVRVNRSRNYSAKNCAWATHREVSENKRAPTRRPRPRRLITAFGETKGLMEWARDPRCTVSSTAIAQRLANGWDKQSAITAPPENRGGSDTVVTSLRAFGETKGLVAWTRDRRCRVKINGITDRLRRGWSPEDAISTPPFKQRAGKVAGGRARGVTAFGTAISVGADSDRR